MFPGPLASCIELKWLEIKNVQKLLYPWLYSSKSLYSLFYMVLKKSWITDREYKLFFIFLKLGATIKV